MDDLCVFCAIAAGDAAATLVRTWDDAVAFLPLHSVTAGHTLVIPRTHVPDAVADPSVSALTMGRAAELGASLGGDMNLLTSVGALATQTVPHLHIHLLPRTAGDGLALPWTAQQASAGEDLS